MCQKPLVSPAILHHSLLFSPTPPWQVVDPCFTTRKAAALAVSHFADAACAVASPAEALARLSPPHHFHLVLLSLSLPDLPPALFVQRLREMEAAAAGEAVAGSGEYRGASREAAEMPRSANGSSAAADGGAEEACSSSACQIPVPVLGMVTDFLSTDMPPRLSDCRVDGLLATPICESHVRTASIDACISSSSALIHASLSYGPVASLSASLIRLASSRLSPSSKSSPIRSQHASAASSFSSFSGRKLVAPCIPRPAVARDRRRLAVVSAVGSAESGGADALGIAGEAYGQMAEALLNGLPPEVEQAVVAVHREIAQLAADAGLSIPLNDPASLRQWTVALVLLVLYAAAPPAPLMGLLDFLVAPLHARTD
ncbi:unnamed protein product, partial [Closterium sp. NIES-54]